MQGGAARGAAKAADEEKEKRLGSEDLHLEEEHTKVTALEYELEQAKRQIETAKRQMAEKDEALANFEVEMHELESRATVKLLISY